MRISYRRVSVCRSVCHKSVFYTETAKRRIMQTTLHDGPGNLVFLFRRSRQNSFGVTPNGGAKCRWGRLNAGAVAANWWLSMRRIANLVRSLVYHTQYPPYFGCSTFAKMQRVARVCQRQLVRVSYWYHRVWPAKILLNLYPKMKSWVRHLARSR